MSPTPIHRLTMRRLLTILAALTASLLPSQSSASSESSKTHMLYMGADFQILHEGALYPVKGVDGSAFIIEVKGKSIRIPTDKGQFSMKIQPGLKLCDRILQVDKLAGEPTYTPENDPARKWMRRQSTIGDVASESSARSDANLRGTPQTQTEIIGATSMGMPITREVANPQYAAAQGKANLDSQFASSDITNSTFYTHKMQEELEKKLFDAFEISFEITSKTSLKAPYLVVITQFKDRDKPNTSKNLIYAQQLDPITNETVRVKKRQAGFPPGYVLEKFQVHLYDGGKEVGTSVAEMQNLLTQDEALQYLIFDHIGKNRGASASASLIMGKVPANVRTLLGEKRYTQTYFVRVSKDGRPLGVFTNESCSEAADAEVSGLVDKLRFVPALDKGKTVEGIARLKLTDVAL